MPTLEPNQKPAWYDSTFFTFVLLILFWPVGLYALYKNRRMGVFGKVVLLGFVMGMFVVGGAALAVGVLYFTKREVVTNYVHKVYPTAPVNNVDLTPHDGPMDDKTLGENDRRKTDIPNTVPANPETILASPTPSDTKPSIDVVSPFAQTRVEPVKVEPAKSKVDDVPPKTEVATADVKSASAAPKTESKPAVATEVPSVEVVDVSNLPAEKALGFPISIPVTPPVPAPRAVPIPTAREPLVKESAPPVSSIVDLAPPTLPKEDLKPPPPPKPNTGDAPVDNDAVQLQKLIDEARQREAEKKAGGATQQPAPNDLNALVAGLVNRSREIAAAQQQQAQQAEKLIADFQASNGLQPQLVSLELSFRDYLRRTYNSESFDDKKLTEYFTDEYLRTYNEQIKGQQAALLQQAQSLHDAIARTGQDLNAVNVEIVIANQKFAGAGMQPLKAAGDPVLDGRLAGLLTRLKSLTAQTVTINDIRQGIGAKASRTPESAPAPVVTAPPIGRAPAPVPAAPAIVTTDIPGIWVRQDGNVVWNVNGNGGVLGTTRTGDQKFHFKWTFDEATSTLSVNHNGVLQIYNVAREGDEVVMRGKNVTGGATLVFRRRK